MPVAVAASSTLDTNATSQAANAMDDNLATRWIATPDTTSTSVQQWLTLDLGTTQTVNAVSSIGYMNNRALLFQSSLNGTTWSNIVATPIGAEDNTDLHPRMRMFAPRSVRYVRVTSTTTINADSFSLWEFSAYNDSQHAVISNRLTTLSNSVSTLVTNTVADKLKRVVLEVALERAQLSLEVAEQAYANALLDDVQAALTNTAATMAAPVAGQPYLSVLRPLHATTTNNNPYLKRMTDGANLSLASADAAWPKNTPVFNHFSDFNFARTTAGDMEGWLWVFAHPNSPLKENPEVLRRLLRRWLSFVDAVEVHTPNVGIGAGFFDDFSMGPASVVFREFATLYPGLLLPSEEAQWQRAMQLAGDTIYAARRDRAASWVNTDVSIAVQLFNFGLLATNQAMLDKAQYFIDDVLTSGRMFADGAVGYIGTQNEAGGYQGTVWSYVGRYYEITGSVSASNILRSMEWYGPINGRMIDWWTSPAWKDAWNFISGSGGAGEAVAGQNPYVRGELDTGISGAATSSNWTGARGSVAWYQPGTTALTRPDYTTFDRNIMGPRAWNGLFNYTATLRKVADNESGLATLMGCQVCDPDPNFRVNASLMGIYPRIRLVAAPSKNADGTLNEGGHAWQATRLNGDSTVNSNFTALGATYKIHQYASSSKGAEVDWTGQQVWLNLPDRIIGLLAIAPNQTLTAYAVDGVIRLGFGGTAYSSTKTLTATGSNSWSYGNLNVKLHQSSYATTNPVVYAFRVANAPITEITLRDSLTSSNNATPVTYPVGTRYAFISEVRPNTATGEVTAQEIALPAGLVGMEVRLLTSGKRYRVVHNPGSATVVYTPDLTGWTGPFRVHSNAQKYRPDWLPASTGSTTPPAFTNTPTQIAIPPYGNIVVESEPAVPAAPSGIAAVLTSTTKAVVTWTDNSDSELGFKLQRKTGSGGAWSWIATHSAGLCVFTNSGLSAGSSYYYRVSAYNGNGNSATNGDALATSGVFNPAVPPVPTNLVVTAVSATEVNLSWPDTTGETGYVIQRRTGTNGVFQSIGSVPAGGISFLDSGLAADTLYGYRLLVPYPGGTNGPGTEVFVTTCRLLALNQAATASAIAGGSSAAFAVDGDTNTAWNAGAGGEQWFTLLAGGPHQNIHSVRLRWDADYATAYTLEASLDSNHWNTVFTETNGNGGLDEIRFGSLQTRFLRLHLTQGINPANYALREFEVFGEPLPVPTTPWGGAVKADNTVDLSNDGSWTDAAVPTNKIATWNSVVTRENPVAVGSDVTFAGIKITNPGGNVILNPGGGTLALGTNGIDLSGSQRTVTLNAPMSLSGPQIWTTGISGDGFSQQLFVNGDISGPGGMTLTSPDGRRAFFSGTSTFTGGFDRSRRHRGRRPIARVRCWPDHAG